MDGKVREHRVTLGEPKGDLIEVIDLPEDVLSVVDQAPRGLGVGSRVEVSSPASSG
jgi:hypothetical protein